jgi:hypothetical protein
MSGHCSKCKAALVWTFGIVEIFVGVVQVPRPVAGIIETKLLPFCIITSSLLMVVPPLTDGDPVERARLDVGPTKFD